MQVSIHFPTECISGMSGRTGILVIATRKVGDVSRATVRRAGVGEYTWRMTQRCKPPYFFIFIVRLIQITQCRFFCQMGTGARAEQSISLSTLCTRLQVIQNNGQGRPRCIFTSTILTCPFYHLGLGSRKWVDSKDRQHAQYRRKYRGSSNPA